MNKKEKSKISKSGKQRREREEVKSSDREEEQRGGADRGGRGWC